MAEPPLPLRKNGMNSKKRLLEYGTEDKVVNFHPLLLPKT
ncbi:hypothetical protein CsSME_00011403 [Camellia sinensis var. sinensis]